MRNCERARPCESNFIASMQTLGQGRKMAFTELLQFWEKIGSRDP